MLKLALIIGSTRPNRFADIPAKWIVEGARERSDFTLDVLDLRDHPLPFFNEPAPVIYTARLYPVNDIANRAGMLTAVITDGHGGRGTFSLNYLGDSMQGEASRVEASHPGFGRVHRDVLGVSDVQLRGPRGIANASGSKAISAQCEYVMSGPSKGTGACVFSDGARYQLHFG